MLVADGAQDDRLRDRAAFLELRGDGLHLLLAGRDAVRHLLGAEELGPREHEALEAAQAALAQARVQVLVEVARPPGRLGAGGAEVQFPQGGAVRADQGEDDVVLDAAAAEDVEVLEAAVVRRQRRERLAAAVAQRQPVQQTDRFALRSSSKPPSRTFEAGDGTASPTVVHVSTSQRGTGSRAFSHFSFL